MLSRYLSPVVEIVRCLDMSAQQWRSCVVSLFQPSSRNRVLSRYVSRIVEIVCCLVNLSPISRDRVLSRYVSPSSRDRVSSRYHVSPGTIVVIV